MSFRKIMSTTKPVRTFRVKESSPRAAAVAKLALFEVQRYQQDQAASPDDGGAAPLPVMGTPDDHGVEWWRLGHTAPPRDRGVFVAPARPLQPYVGRMASSWVQKDADGAEWCQLCGNKLAHGHGFHYGFDRDHVALNAMFYFSTMYPRAWAPADVFFGARAPFPSVWRGATAAGEVITRDDNARLAELGALLRHLARPPHDVIGASLRDERPGGLTGHGEKIFRAAIISLSTAMLPAMGPNVQAAFSQKAWGRTNLMLIYERTGLAEYQATENGLPPKHGRSDKSAVVRQLITELAMAQFDAALPPVAAELADMALHRLAFECVVQKSMHYMVRVQRVAAELGFPTPKDLIDTDFS
jgi:hypothetical protein